MRTRGYRAYICRTGVLLRAGETVTFPLNLRIDRPEVGAGRIAVNVTDGPDPVHPDLDRTDDIAALAVQVAVPGQVPASPQPSPASTTPAPTTAGSAGAGSTGALPVTVASVVLVAGAGALLLLLGAAAALLAGRRRAAGRLP